MRLLGLRSVDATVNYARDLVLSIALGGGFFIYLTAVERVNGVCARHGVFVECAV